jgi:putative salt-induced outer membrane protein
MRALNLFVALFVIFTVVIEAHGEEKRWSDEAELSFVNTGGNTDVMTLSAKNNLKYKFTDKLAGSWAIEALYGETDGEKNAERYFTELRLDYLFTERFYTFGMGGGSKISLRVSTPGTTWGPA